MIYTSNCILSKVVSETSVAAFSTVHLSPAGLVSFVCLLSFPSFLVQVAPEWTSAWGRRSMQATPVPVTRAGFFWSPDSSPSLARRTSPGGARIYGARVFDGGASCRADSFVLTRTRPRGKNPHFARYIGIDYPFYNQLYHVNLNLQIHLSRVYSPIHLFFCLAHTHSHSRSFPSYHTRRIFRCIFMT